MGLEENQGWKTWSVRTILNILYKAYHPFHPLLILTLYQYLRNAYSVLALLGLHWGLKQK